MLAGFQTIMCAMFWNGCGIAFKVLENHFFFLFTFAALISVCLNA